MDTASRGMRGPVLIHVTRLGPCPRRTGRGAPARLRKARAGLTALAACLVAACGSSAPAVLGLPGHDNDHVSLAAHESFVGVTWAASLNGRTSIHAAVSRDGGETFSPPVRVSRDTAPPQTNGEQPPRIALVPRPGLVPEVVIVWLARGTDGTELLVARSTDGARTFVGPEVVAGTSATGNRGWHALAADADGRVHVIWLDHREASARTPEGHAHHHGASRGVSPEDGTARAQLSQLYAVRLDDPLPGEAVTRGVCYCCKTALAAGPDGAVYAAWRHVYPGNMRDIAFAMTRGSEATYTTPVRVSADEWQLDGCPENGPALAVDTRRTVHVVWPTVVNESGREALRLFHAYTTDGRSFSARVPLPAGAAAYHPQVVAGPDGSLFAAWEEITPEGRYVRAARGALEASRGMVFQQALDIGPGVYPTVVATREHVLLFWTGTVDGRSMLMVKRLANPFPPSSPFP